MSNFKDIELKLKEFAKKYYTNELIKGIILFAALGLVYLFVTLFIEYILWLKPLTRTMLFWLFIIVELFLLIRFIGFPIFKIVGLKKGITNEEISKIIGNHFTEVKDKLTNVLQLKKNTVNSELLLASIEQKSQELQPIPFTKAIDFKGNIRYIKYALIPIFIWLVTLISGKTTDLTQSLNRVVNHNTAYEAPAPFSFHVTDDKMNVIQGESITVHIQIKGEFIPEEPKIIFDNEQYFLENQGNGLFSYTFLGINKPTTFYLTANDISSRDYQIDIIKTPVIQQIGMKLIYPKHLKKRSEQIKNTGNITVPEGTTIIWNVNTFQTDSVTFINNDKKTYFKKTDATNYNFTKRIIQNINYQISTSNKNISDFEKLQFSIQVVKDEMPQISVKSNIDSISRGQAFFAGQISDDNGLRKLELVYYDIDNPQQQLKKSINITKENVQTFFYEFPNTTLGLKDGINYELFFQVYDNDGFNGYKKMASERFSYRKQTYNEEKEKILDEQKDYIDELTKSLKKQEKSKKALEKIQFDLQNKKQVNWNDQKKIKNLVKRQQKYNEMMQRQTKQLQENFSEKKEETKSLQQKKEELQKRIEELKKMEKQQKLLKELKKMAEKLNKEDLVKKAKELSAQNKQQERSLERILELTKQFYVEQKMNQLSEKLNDLAKKQEEISKKDTNKTEQEKLTKEFEGIKKDLEKLKKDNEKLKKPLDIPSLEELKRDTDKQQKGAEKDIENNKKQSAKKKQQKASDNMKQMSNKMQKSMQSMNMEMQEENQQDLRYILENLLTFSFDQEDLMNKFSKITAGHPNFSKNLRKQFQLKNYFEHIDDSLFALSLRSPKISTKIDTKIATAHYNIDQSLENLAETNFRNGVKNQRYVMTAVNELADMLSDVLDAMKNPKQGKGSGKGKGKSFSLPDIIKKQGEMQKKMQQAMKKKQGKGGKKDEKGKAEKGKKGKEPGEEGEGNSEEMSGELYKIYQEQSRLREEFENATKNRGGTQEQKLAKKIATEMKQLENQILERGLNRQSLSKMQRLNQQMLKLKEASYEKGEDEKRKSTTNEQKYNVNKAKLIEFKKKYLNQTEILNRQALPLKDIYKKKVQEYFTH